MLIAYLHIASQNCSSGRRGKMEWHKNPDNVRKSKEVLKIIIDDFIVNPAYRDTVTSIQPANEPAGYDDAGLLPVLKQYYYDSYGALRHALGDEKQTDTLLRYAGPVISALLILL